MNKLYFFLNRVRQCWLNSGLSDSTNFTTVSFARSIDESPVQFGFLKGPANLSALSNWAIIPLNRSIHSSSLSFLHSFAIKGNCHLTMMCRPESEPFSILDGIHLAVSNCKIKCIFWTDLITFHGKQGRMLTKEICEAFLCRTNSISHFCSESASSKLAAKIVDRSTTIFLHQMIHKE